MMKRLPLYLSYLLASILGSCMSFDDDPPLTAASFEYLKRQLSPNGKYYIYDYSIWGPMAWSLETKGTLLMKKGETFDPKAGEIIEGSVVRWIAKDSLLGYQVQSGAKANDTLPLAVSFKNYEGLVVKTETYAPGSGGNGFLTCDSVEFGNNFIRLHGVNQPETTVSYPLGAVSVKTDSGVVKQIQVEIFSKRGRYEVEPFSSGLMSDFYTYTLAKPMDPALFDRPGIYMDVKNKLFK